MAIRRVDIKYKVDGATKAQREVQKVAKAEVDLSKAVNSASKAIATQISQFKDYGRSATSAAGAADRLNASNSRMARSASQASTASRGLGMSFGSLGAAAVGLNQGLQLLQVGVRSIESSFQSLREGAQLRDVERSFQRLGGSTQILEGARGALGGAVTDADIQRYFNTARALGISAEKFEQITAAAKAAGTLLGRDVNFMLESLSLGVARQSRLLLDNAGITLDLTKHQDEYAASLGVTADKLTEAQRKQAFWNAFVAESNRLIEAAPTKAAADSYDRLGAAIGNAADRAKKSLSESFAPVFESLTERITLLTATLDELEGRRGDLEDVAGSRTLALVGQIPGLGLAATGIQQAASANLRALDEREAYRNREIDQLEEILSLHQARLAAVEGAAADPLTQAIEGNAAALQAEAEGLRVAIAAAQELLSQAQSERFLSSGAIGDFLGEIRGNIQRLEPELLGAAAAGDSLSQILLTATGRADSLQFASGLIEGGLSGASQFAGALAGGLNSANSEMVRHLSSWDSFGKIIDRYFGKDFFRGLRQRRSGGRARAAAAQTQRADLALASVDALELDVQALEAEILPGLQEGFTPAGDPSSFFLEGLGIGDPDRMGEIARQFSENFVDPTVYALSRLGESFSTMADQSFLALSSMKEIGESAFNSMTQGIGQAAAAALIHGSSFTKSIKEVTASVLESIAVQAFSQAAYMAAIGIALSAGLIVPGLGVFGAAGASAAFASAAALGGVGVAAGLAARAMGGGGSGGAVSAVAASGGFDVPASPSAGLGTDSGQATTVINVSFAGRPFTTERELSREVGRLVGMGETLRGGPVRRRA